MSRLCSCSVCVAWFNPLPDDEDEGQNSDPIAFSKTPCPGHGDECHLAGERYIEHEIIDGKVEHLELCSSCYLAFHGVLE